MVAVENNNYNKKTKFWRMVYTNNTPKMVVLLTYAFLEWILIGLLFIGGLFSYLISAFAEFFGLDPPCFLCSHALGAHRLHYCSRHHLARADHTRELEEEDDDEEEETFDGEESREMMAVMEDPIISLSRAMEVEERLIPLELVDFSTKSDAVNRNEDHGQKQEEKEDLFPVVETPTNSDLVNLPFFSGNDNGDDNSLTIARGQEGEPEAAFVPVVESVEDSNLEYVFRSIPVVESMDVQEEEEEEEEEAYGEFQVAAEEEEEGGGGGKIIDVEDNCEISIWSEICDEDQTIPPIADDGEEEEEDIPELTVSVLGHLNLSVCPELINEVEEERMPETPTSIDSLRSLHKKFLFERREFGMESLDGSVTSEMDGSELLTVDHLKAALKSERTALTALYAELEEERNASAIAANQTMAMITRLQGEKAAMQMEALQYQRMMEEQSEYDQEALQLLNELMMKREKEKQELEKELEAYREKVYSYEAKERRLMSSSGSLSADESNIDVSSESRDGEDHQNTPPTCDVLSFAADQHLISLDDSLADFEEERASILEQLKILEEKLLSLEDDLTSIGFGHNFADANGDYESFGHNVPSSGRRRRLLPLFDATVVDMGSDEVLSNGSPDSFFKSAAIDDNQKKLANISEEVDNVYERLQALEADKDFLKRCIGSLKKGDEGMDLLQEILQHLRGLRNVQLRVRNAGYALATLSFYLFGR